ncbi:RIM1 [Candida jiufengensis]|uniref:RIM1 n=1 Tax=Candida jiufengensis TaxID=497108 RepID=UPI00222455EE|nr:RIM1 [Candida jiufengensis]KAI5953431.1 RIM1 [Candida jiufengensis]
MLRTFTRSFSSTLARYNYAKGQLFGRVGGVDFRESENGTKYIKYSLAVNRFKKGEENDTATEWYNITVLDEDQLRRSEKVLRKGNKMIVDVQIRADKYEDPETKKINYRNSFVQKNFEIVNWGKKPEEEGTETTE